MRIFLYKKSNCIRIVSHIFFYLPTKFCRSVYSLLSSRNRDVSPPVARTRVSVLDRHADATANRWHPLVDLNGGSRAAAADWPVILFHPTSHRSRAAPARGYAGFAPDATCIAKFLREPLVILSVHQKDSRPPDQARHSTEKLHHRSTCSERIADRDDRDGRNFFEKKKEKKRKKRKKNTESSIERFNRTSGVKLINA
ncbi:hypothetical protein PUN28_019035 [Cardiocondyla obscurior]|uniref:Uncharacterized protein n=1 Tax=Cardiocondyla obscurior TaxID=286306 RepID=A0AAW2EFU7_9HYME